MKLTPNRILETFALHRSIEGAFFVKVYQFSSDRLFSFIRQKKEHFKNYLSSFLKNVEYQAVIKFFTWKDLNATEISKELNSVYKNDAPSYRTVAKWVVEFKDPERGFEDSLPRGRPSTIITDQNIEVIERIVMSDRLISVRRLAYELPIPTTSLFEHE